MAFEDKKTDTKNKSPTPTTKVSMTHSYGSLYTCEVHSVAAPRIKTEICTLRCLRCFLAQQLSHPDRCSYYIHTYNIYQYTHILV